MNSEVETLEARNKAVSRVVELLAAKEYSALQLLSGSHRLSAAQIKTAVEEYGRTLLPLPDAARDQIDYVTISASQGMEWSVYCPMFTFEEGLSDLTLDLTLRLGRAGQYEVVVNGLHVL